MEVSPLLVAYISVVNTVGMLFIITVTHSAMF